MNVLGTVNAFEVVRKRRDQIKRIVYASSVAVFGPEEFYGPGQVQEGAPLLYTTAINADPDGTPVEFGRTWFAGDRIPNREMSRLRTRFDGLGQFCLSSISTAASAKALPI